MTTSHQGCLKAGWTAQEGNAVDPVFSHLVDILIIEDDPGDALLIQDFLSKSRDTSPRGHVASDGEQALRFVRQIGEFAGAPRPRLILLDLNLAGIHGLELLAALKGDEDLRTIPVVVLSSSSHPADIERSYALHANAYVVKPVDLDEFANVIKNIDITFVQVAEPAPQRETPHPVLNSHDSRTSS